MTATYTLTLDPGREIDPEERRRLKTILGDVTRLVLGSDAPVSIDHIGLPVKDMDQVTTARTFA